MDRLKSLFAALQRTAPYTAWNRYSNARGNLLAGGVTYFSFLSVFPAVALAFTVFGVVLRGHPEWLDEIRTYLAQTLPGFIKDDEGNGLIPITIPSSNTLSIAGVVSVAGLAWSGLGWFSALQSGIREIFGIKGTPGNAVTDIVRNLGVMVAFGVGFVVSAAISAVAGSLASRVAGAIGLSGQGWLLTVAGLLVGIVLDGALVVLLVRALVGVRVPWPALRVAALVGGIGLSALKLIGARLISASSNPVYGSIGVVVGLLLWLYFIARIILFATSWAANDYDALAPGDSQPADAGVDVAVGGPQAAASSRTAAPPAFGQHTQDRVSVAAGAVLGAAGAFAVGSVVRALRSVVSIRRR